MSDPSAFVQEWHECPYCKKRKWCSEKAFFEHIEDCDKRPRKRSGAGCPKCGSLIERTALINFDSKRIV